MRGELKDFFNKYSLLSVIILTLITLLLTFYGGYKILVSAKSHVDFWPALGSWVGGVATVYAVIVAIISYNANKTENQRVLLFNVKTELDYELLPDVEIHIHQNLNVLLAIIFKIRRGEEVIEYDKELLVSKRDSLLMYKNKLIRKTKLLNKLRGLNVEYESEYEDYMHTLANILLANYFVIQFIDNKNIVDLEEEFNNLKNFCVFCEKYIVDNYYQKNNLTSNGFSNFFFITKLMETIRNYYNLKSYQL